MRKLLNLMCVACLFLMPAYADIVLPIAGTVSGAFANPTGGSTVSGNSWYYDSTDGSVQFVGTPFNRNTSATVPFSFGTITFTNTSSQPTGTFTADLDVTVNFTTPTGTVLFTDGLQLTAQSGGGQSGHGDTLTFGSFPAPQPFTAGGYTYTVSYLGFYDSATVANNPLADLFVLNPGGSSTGGGTATACLWGSVTAAGVDPPPTAVPEPASVLLLGTLGVVIAGALRKRCSRTQ